MNEPTPLTLTPRRSFFSRLLAGVGAFGLGAGTVEDPDPAVDAAAMEQQIEELKRQQSDYYDANKSAEIGKMVGAAFRLDPKTGSPEVFTTGGGTAALVIDALVVDEHGAHIGSLQAICERAIAAWEAELRAAGVPPPP